MRHFLRQSLLFQLLSIYLLFVLLGGTEFPDCSGNPYIYSPSNRFRQFAQFVG